MTRRKMCHRGCPCPPCAAQREIDLRYIKNRKSDPSIYPSQIASYRRGFRVGLTVGEVKAMEEACGNLCQICGKPEYVLSIKGKVKALAIDHDHATGKVRGLLCNNCNRGLGLLKHDLDRMEKAVAYLRRAASA